MACLPQIAIQPSGREFERRKPVFTPRKPFARRKPHGGIFRQRSLIVASLAGPPIIPVRTTVMK